MDMTNIFSIIFMLALIWFSAFFQLPIIVWTLLIGIPLLLLSVFGYICVVPLIILWIGFVLAALFSNLTQLRQTYIIAPAIKFLRKKMPSISVTEREAIDAGDTWWEKELFCGKPDWRKLFNIPKPALTQEEEQFLQQQVETLCTLIDDWQSVNKDGDLSPAVWNFLKSEKFFGMAIPKEYGGLGFSALAHSTIVSKIATRSISGAVTTMVPNSLGPAELLLHYGTQAQKDQYLPKLAIGEEIPCFALTAPDAGSDAGAIPDSGIVCRGMYEGKEVLGIKLSWDKRYITLAPLATLLGVAFHLYDPDHLLGDKTDIGITLCLIPSTHPGVELGHRHYPMYLAFMNGPTRGKDVFIPIDWIIGGADMAGQGWRMLMECLSIGRSISLPALSSACAKITYRFTGAYARVRRQFNVPISAFEGVEEALGYIAGYAYLLEATRTMTAGAVDLKINPATVSAIAKYHMTTMAREIVSHAMDIHAGQMIQAGPRNFLANIYMAVPISITVEGANILTRNLIIFGQGAIRCHPYVLKEAELISAPTPDVKALDNVLMAHIGFFLRNFMRSLTYGLTGGLFIQSHYKNKRIRKYARQLTRMSSALALFADTSLILLGGSLKRRERISARLGDMLSQLYLASAVLKYFHDHGELQTDEDYVIWCLRECLYKIQIACDELSENFPYKIVGKLLHAIIFPFGSTYKSPSDKLHHTIVTSMLQPSEFRDRLTKYCFIGSKNTDPGVRLDNALAQIETIEPILRKIHKGLQGGMIAKHLDFSSRLIAAKNANLITDEEMNQLVLFEKLRSEIIKVNEFSFDLETVIA